MFFIIEATFCSAYACYFVILNLASQLCSLSLNIEDQWAKKSSLNLIFSLLLEFKNAMKEDT